MTKILLTFIWNTCAEKTAANWPNKNCSTEIVCKKLQTLGVLRWGCRMRVELPFNIMWCLQPCMLKDNDGKCSWKLLLVIQNIILVSNSSGPKKNSWVFAKKEISKSGHNKHAIYAKVNRTHWFLVHT